MDSLFSRFIRLWLERRIHCFINILCVFIFIRFKSPKCLKKEMWLFLNYLPFQTRIFGFYENKNKKKRRRWIDASILHKLISFYIHVIESQFTDKYTCLTRLKITKNTLNFLTSQLTEIHDIHVLLGFKILYRFAHICINMILTIPIKKFNIWIQLHCLSNVQCS